MRDHEDGLAIAPHDYTVADAVNDWLSYGLTGRSAATIEKYGYLCRGHVISDLGAQKLRDLSAEDVDKWLADKANRLSTSTVQRLHECLNRAVSRAMARDKVKRNVVGLCGVPTAYLVISLLVGARTEVLRALTWDHVDLDAGSGGEPGAVSGSGVELHEARCDQRERPVLVGCPQVQVEWGSGGNGRVRGRECGARVAGRRGGEAAHGAGRRHQCPPADRYVEDGGLHGFLPSGARPRSSVLLGDARTAKTHASQCFHDVRVIEDRQCSPAFVAVGSHDRQYGTDVCSSLSEDWPLASS